MQNTRCPYKCKNKTKEPKQKARNMGSPPEVKRHELIVAKVGHVDFGPKDGYEKLACASNCPVSCGNIGETDAEQQMQKQKKRKKQRRVFCAVFFFQFFLFVQVLYLYSCFHVFVQFFSFCDCKSLRSKNSAAATSCLRFLSTS